MTWKRGAALGRERRRGSGQGTSAAPTEPCAELGKPPSASVGTTRASAELGKLPPCLRSALVAAAAGNGRAGSGGAGRPRTCCSPARPRTAEGEGAPAREGGPQL